MVITFSFKQNSMLTSERKLDLLEWPFYIGTTVIITIYLDSAT